MSGVLAIGVALCLAENVIWRDTGTAEMQVISNLIKEGAKARPEHRHKIIGTLRMAVALLVCAFGGFKTVIYFLI